MKKMMAHSKGMEIKKDLALNVCSDYEKNDVKRIKKSLD